MVLDIAHGHPAGIEHDDQVVEVVEVVKASLAPGHPAGREAPVPVPGVSGSNSPTAAMTVFNGVPLREFEQSRASGPPLS